MKFSSSERLEAEVCENENQAAVPDALLLLNADREMPAEQSPWGEETPQAPSAIEGASGNR